MVIIAGEHENAPENAGQTRLPGGFPAKNAQFPSAQARLALRKTGWHAKARHP
ncbi:MAG TPA: hypothetical protein VIO38_07285 [Rariglobus sp.]